MANARRGSSLSQTALDEQGAGLLTEWDLAVHHQDDSDFRRLLLLKRAYEAQSLRLGQVTGRSIKRSRFLPDSDSESSEEESPSSLTWSASDPPPRAPLVDSDEAEPTDEQPSVARRPVDVEPVADSFAERTAEEHDSPRSRRRVAGGASGAGHGSSPADVERTIRFIIELHGGSCHGDTIVEHLKARWQIKGVLKPDGTPFGHADCRKLVQSGLKLRRAGRSVFVVRKPGGLDERSRSRDGGGA
jgi:hypothetical protein